MDNNEFKRWQEITSSSRYRWVEDAVTRLNGANSRAFSFWSLAAQV